LHPVEDAVISRFTLGQSLKQHRDGDVRIPRQPFQSILNGMDSDTLENVTAKPIF
jgi:hypothetical protein